MGGKVKLADVGGIISQVAVTGEDINMGSLLLYSRFSASSTILSLVAWT